MLRRLLAKLASDPRSWAVEPCPTTWSHGTEADRASPPLSVSQSPAQAGQGQIGSLPSERGGSMECGQEVRKGVGTVVSAKAVRAPVADVDGDTVTCQDPCTSLQPQHEYASKSSRASRRTSTYRSREKEVP